MPSFFDKGFEEQVKVAIDNSDVKLLQVLLGPKYCQLWKYWLMYSILSYDITVVTKTLKYQLPINILTAQSQVLAEFFPSIYRGLPVVDDIDIEEQEGIEGVLDQWYDNIRNYRATSDQAYEVNSKLEHVEQEILKKYRSFTHDDQEDLTDHSFIEYARNQVRILFADDTESKTVSIRPMFDPIRRFSYHYHGNDYEEENNCIKEITEKFRDNVALQHVLSLDLPRSYDDMYREVSEEIIEKYKLRISQGDLIYNLYHGPSSLAVKTRELVSNDIKMGTVITSASKVINRIKDEKFVEEMYDQLMLNIANRTSDNPFLLDDLREINATDTIEGKIAKIKKKVKVNDDYKLLNKLMEYAVTRDEPNMDIINVLIVNGASLMNSYVIDSRQQQSVTVKEYFLNNLKGKYAAIVNKSIFTAMKAVHTLLFNFSVIKDGVNLVDIISAIPSEDGNFSKDIRDVRIFGEIGGEGAKEFINLLKNSIDKYVHGKELSSSKDMWLKKLYVVLFGASCTVNHEDYQSACKKLYDSLNVGYLAVVTGDNTVILDYIEEIEDEVRHSKNTVVRELYNDFLKLLREYKELPKSMFLVRWYNYFYRTVKSYTWEWDPAWEKILTGPGYRTDVGEWSKDKFEEIEKAERHEKSTRLAQSEARNRELEEGISREAQRAEQEAQRAEQNAQRAEQLELEKVIVKAFSKKISKFDDDFQEIIEKSEDKIVEAVVQCVKQHGSSPEQVLNAIIEEIKFNKNQVLRDGTVDNELIEIGIRSFPSQGTSLSNVNVSQGTSAGISRF